VAELPAPSPIINSMRPAEDGEWDEIAAASDCATYFHTRAWAELWCRRSAGALRPVAVLATFSDGKRALLPSSEKYALDMRLFGRGLPGLRTTVSSNGNGYGGWISNSPLASLHHELLWERCADRNLLIHQNPLDDGLRGASIPWTNEDFTQVVDLRPPLEEIRRRWARGHNSAFNKAERAGLTAAVATTPAEWQVFYDIYAGSFDRWGQPDDAFDRAMFDLLAEHDSSGIQLWLVRQGDTVLAGAVILRHGRTAMYWLGAFRKEFQHLRAAPFLHGQVMQSCRSEGAWWYDFNPSGGIEGVVTFKERFGAVRYPANTAVRTVGLKRRMATLSEFAPSLRR
jgi:hypothetical protein